MKLTSQTTQTYLEQTQHQAQSSHHHTDGRQNTHTETHPTVWYSHHSPTEVTKYYTNSYTKLYGTNHEFKGCQKAKSIFKKEGLITLKRKLLLFNHNGTGGQCTGLSQHSDSDVPCLVDSNLSCRRSSTVAHSLAGSPLFYTASTRSVASV